MKFPFPLLNGLQDAQQNFEQLEGLDILNLTAESVMQLAVTGTARKVAFGFTSVTFSASQVSSTATITHGLGVAPSSIAFAMTNNGTVAVFDMRVQGTPGATTFQALSVCSASVSVGLQFYWTAIG